MKRIKTSSKIVAGSHHTSAMIALEYYGDWSLSNSAGSMKELVLPA